MIIQHNIMALNSHRQLGINNTSLSKNLEKLSSGYRINKAADDAAGLAISEKMRAQIKGLDRAILNAQDGASLIQTAEGALTEVHSMLNRMVELATESANGTFQASDRQKIEAETTALKDEIDRISEATNFNGIQLLDGSLSTSGVTEIELGNLNTTLTAATTGSATITFADATNAVGDSGKLTASIALSDGSSYTYEYTVVKDEGATGTTGKLTIGDSTYDVADVGTIKADELRAAVMGELSKDTTFTQKFKMEAGDGTITLTAREAGTAAASVTAVGATANGTSVADVTVASTGATDAYKTSDAIKVFDGGATVSEEAAVFSVNGVKFAVAKDAASAEKLSDKGVNVMIAETVDEGAAKNLAALINQKTGLKVAADGTNLKFEALNGTGKGLTMQVGDTADAFNKITVSVDDMSTVGLGIAGISMATQESASAALDAVKAAIEKVSANRGDLGALQNRLEHTVNNLGVTTENMTAAESRIRDVDMAKEMTQFTKNNVLSQAAQAMLAQANMQPQQILSLLG